MREQKRQIGDQELRLPERPAEVEPCAGRLPARKGDLSLEQIKEWVDAYRVMNDGKFPTTLAGPVLNADGSATGETWNGLDQLFIGGHKGSPARGLRDSGFSSLADFLDTIYSEEREVRVEKRDLSLEQIKEWVDAYRAMNGGKFPSRLAGSVVNADGSTTGETWNGISLLLRTGQQGQRARGLQHTGFSSLPDFLDKTYSADREDRIDLSLAQIKEWVDAYRAKNDGKFPSANAGSVVNADGSATGETWKGISLLLRTGQEGQRARGLQHTGFASLPDFLDKTYSRDREVKGDLSLEQIREWVDAYRAMNGGMFPSANTGPVVNADGSKTGETWDGISTLLRAGQKGQPARGLQHTGFSSLADFLDKSYPTERKQELSLEQIKEWVDAYRAKNDGKFPSMLSGPVDNRDGSATGETWSGLSQLLLNRKGGRPARGLQDTGFSSLADFLDRTYPTERKQELSLDRVKEWVDAYRAGNDGKFPSQHAGAVLNADGSATGETWRAIAALFVQGSKGSPARGLQHTGFSSLPDFLDKTYSLDRKVKGDLSLEQIKEWVDAYRARNGGKFPTKLAGPVVNADGSATGETWVGIDQLLRLGQAGSPARGLQNTGFSSLPDFLDKTYPSERARELKERTDRPTSDDINVLLDLLE